MPNLFKLMSSKNIDYGSVTAFFCVTKSKVNLTIMDILAMMEETFDDGKVTSIGCYSKHKANMISRDIIAMIEETIDDVKDTPFGSVTKSKANMERERDLRKKRVTGKDYFVHDLLGLIGFLTGKITKRTAKS
jgi:hypothetical protein